MNPKPIEDTIPSRTIVTKSGTSYEKPSLNKNVAAAKEKAALARVVTTVKEAEASKYCRSPMGVTMMSSTFAEVKYGLNIPNPFVMIGEKATPETRYAARLIP